MPIKIANNLPAAKTLEAENIFVMTEDRASHQDIRPLHILVLNLMPTKEVTETQLLRLLGNTPLQVDVDLMQTVTHTAKNTSKEYLLEFYQSFNDLRHKHYDGLIITGAPVEQIPFEEVDYWDELCEIIDWAHTHVYSTLYICWGAQAGLYHLYGINKYQMPQKLSGIYKHRPLYSNHPLTRGFDEVFHMPHSRHTEVRQADIDNVDKLRVVATSDAAGPTIIASEDGREVFITGHCEYDRLTLAHEYQRDVGRGLNPQVPRNYFPGDDPNAVPPMTWCSHAHLFFSNWLNYFVYQQTPYDLELIATL